MNKIQTRQTYENVTQWTFGTSQKQIENMELWSNEVYVFG